jgi:hypothetical protein
MKKIIFYSIIVLLFASCSTTKQLSPIEVKSMTTRQIEADYDVTFRAVVSLLQSEGFLVETVNKEVGLINASKRVDNKNAAAQRFLLGTSKDASTAKAVFNIEEINKETVEVKLTIYEGSISSSNSYWGTKNTDVKDSMVQDATVYNNWFNSLRAEVERRKVLR